MSTSELKVSLHQLIDSTENNTLLKTIHAFLSKFKAKKSVTLTKEEKKVVDEVLKSIMNGNVTSHEEVMAKMKQKYPTLIK
jgi:predicted transcriptional regulator